MKGQGCRGSRGRGHGATRRTWLPVILPKNKQAPEEWGQAPLVQAERRHGDGVDINDNSSLSIIKLGHQTRRSAKWAGCQRWCRAGIPPWLGLEWVLLSDSKVYNHESYTSKLEVLLQLLLVVCLWAALWEMCRIQCFWSCAHNMGQKVQIARPPQRSPQRCGRMFLHWWHKYLRMNYKASEADSSQMSECPFTILCRSPFYW